MPGIKTACSIIAFKGKNRLNILELKDIFGEMT